MRFALWDTSDHLYDSVVVLDDLAWSETALTPGDGVAAEGGTVRYVPARHRMSRR